MTQWTYSAQLSQSLKHEHHIMKQTVRSNDIKESDILIGIDQSSLAFKNRLML